MGLLSLAEDNLEPLQVPFLNCSQPGSFLGSVPHCCSDAGFDIPGEILLERLLFHACIEATNLTALLN